jgi:hypothetical protein
VDFPDNIHIMVFLVCLLLFRTALLQKEILKNKTKRKPTLTTKQIKNTKRSHASNVAIEVTPILQWKRNQILLTRMVVYRKITKIYHTYLYQHHLKTKQA